VSGVEPDDSEPIRLALRAQGGELVEPMPEPLLSIILSALVKENK